MSGFEEEAFERARKMAHSRPNGSPPREEKKPAPPREEPKPPPKPPAVSPKPAGTAAAPNMLEILFQNKENSLILMLLLLLMDEKSDPTLVFTLMYLLM